MTYNSSTGIVIPESQHSNLEFWSVDSAGNAETPHKTVTDFSMS